MFSKTEIIAHGISLLICQTARVTSFHALRIAPLAPPADYPHDVRHTQRTVVMNREELFPLMNRLARNRFEEDDPRLAGAPELYPSFFGNSPWQYGHPPNSIFPDPFGPRKPKMEPFATLKLR